MEMRTPGFSHFSGQHPTCSAKTPMCSEVQLGAGPEARLAGGWGSVNVPKQAGVGGTRQ